MRSSWTEPFLWIHLAGLAAVPIFLELCLLGLAMGDPVLPPWLELSLVGGVGALPVLWMQLVRPFYIFSILVLAVKPEHLTTQQQRLLLLFKTPLNRGLALIGTVFMGGVLLKLYALAPIATPLLPPGVTDRWLGLLVATLAFALSHLFLQVPLSVLAPLWVSDQQLTTLAPYPYDRIASDFTIPGWQVKQVLPSLIPAASLTSTHQTSPESASLPAARVVEPVPVAEAIEVLPVEPLPPVEPPAETDLL